MTQHQAALAHCGEPGSGQSVDCEVGNASTSGGLPGCCATATGSANRTVRLKPECDNGGIWADDDTGTVYVRVFRVSGTWTCSNYTLTWGDY